MGMHLVLPAVLLTMCVYIYMCIHICVCVCVGSIPGGLEGPEPFQCPLLSDEVLYNFILPSFESVFMGRSVHRSGRLQADLT